MIRFVLNSSIFLFGFCFLLWLGLKVLSYSVERYEFKQSNTESNLLILEKNRHYDYLLLGNSHARNFSRHGNHERLNNIWQKEFLNLGQGLGICGPNDQLLYLKYALSKNISFDKLIYVISPPYLYGNHINQNTKTFFREPVKLGFLWEAIKHPAPNKMARLNHYLRSKGSPLWLDFRPAANNSKDEFLNRIDSTTFENGFARAYPFGRKESAFQENIAILEESMALARSQGGEIVLLSTPALFGHWPGQERVARYCDSLMLQHDDISYLDLSYAIQEPTLFYDHHHLNSNGIDSLAIQLKSLLH